MGRDAAQSEGALARGRGCVGASAGMTMARPDRANAEALRQARLCAQRGEWLSAEGICRYLLEANPADAAALLLLAELCFAQGRPAEALDAYDQILRDK